MFCTQCGKLLPEGSDSCLECGYQKENAPIAQTYAASPATIPEREIDSELSLITPRVAALEATSVVLEPVASHITEPVSKGVTGVHTKPDPFYAPSSTVIIAKVALSIVLGVLVFAFLVTSIVLMATRPGSATRVIEMADVTWLLEDTEIGAAIIDSLNSSTFSHVSFSAKNINEFLNRENVAAEIGKVAEKYTTAIAEGNYDYYLSSREIARFVRSVEFDIYDEFGIVLKDADYEFITNSINDYVDLSDFSVGRVFEDAELDAAIPYLLFSIYPLIIIALLGSVCVFDLFLLHRKRIRAAFLSAGIPFVLSGLLCVIASLLLGPYSGLFRNSGFYGVAGLIAGAVNLLLLPGLISLVVGVLSIVVFVIIAGKREHRIPMKSDESTTKAWRITLIITNASILLICSALSLLLYINIPQS